MPGTFLNTLYKFISYNLYNESNEVQFNFKQENEEQRSYITHATAYNGHVWQYCQTSKTVL